MWKVVLLMFMFMLPVFAGEVDDFGDAQDTLSDIPDTVETFSSWQTLAVPDRSMWMVALLDHRAAPPAWVWPEGD
jgi:hypothetical protein